MANSSYIFTSESVTEGHPDKICDQISDAVLDAILAKEIELAEQGYISPSGVPADPSAVRCACETMATTGMVLVTGEIRTQAYVDVPAIVREVLEDIGYNRAKYGSMPPPVACSMRSTINLLISLRASISPSKRRRAKLRTAIPRSARATRA